MLNVTRLKVLDEVARRGSFSAAADALVLHAVRGLPADRGARGRDRDDAAASATRAGSRLTAAGQTLVGHAEGILARLEAAEAELAAIAGLRGGRLRMASFPTAGATLMPLAIATFRARHPEVELTLAEGEPEEIEPRLRAGEFDLALLFEFGAASSTDELARVTLLEDPLYLALPREHALAQKRRLRLEDLRGEAWVQTSQLESLRAPRRAQLPRGWVRAERGVRERRLPDRPGPRRGRRRCRPDPRAGAVQSYARTSRSARSPPARRCARWSRRRPRGRACCRRRRRCWPSSKPRRRGTRRLPRPARPEHLSVQSVDQCAGLDRYAWLTSRPSTS